MKRSDVTMLLLLAALWGASYLFMRVSAGEFGAVALAGARAAGAAVLLVALVARRGQLAHLRRHWKAIVLVGLTSSALPFVLFAYAALTITAGLSSIFNAATPLWAAAIGLAWFGQRLDATRLLGLGIGFAGVTWLVWDSASVRTGAGGSSAALAVVACLAATVLYGFAANYSKQRLDDVPSLAVAAGSQLVSALVLAVPALVMWPTTMPSARAWSALAALTVGCTAIAYVLFFRLISNIGAARATTVSFLIPAFAVLWGALFLGESVTLDMALGCGVILVGTGLTTGLVRRRSVKTPAADTAGA
jgi:drug/metabolite transporter (DMT)-like permease